MTFCNIEILLYFIYYNSYLSIFASENNFLISFIGCLAFSIICVGGYNNLWICSGIVFVSNLSWLIAFWAIL